MGAEAMPILLSVRATPQVESLFAVICKVNGIEGVVRRHTSSGTQPFVTDDRALVEQVLALAKKRFPHADLTVVRFDRTEVVA